MANQLLGMQLEGSWADISHDTAGEMLLVSVCRAGGTPSELRTLVRL